MSWLVTLREQQSRDGPAAPSATAYMPAAKTAFGMPAKAPDAFLAKLSQAEACDAVPGAAFHASASARFVQYQRSNRDYLWTYSHNQPVGGRQARAYKLAHSARADEWSAAEEAAFQKAFGRSSTRATPTGM